MSVKKYRVYCNDEAIFVTGWSEAEPDTCYNNNTHVIDTNQTAIVDIQTPTNVRVIQTYEDATQQDSYYLYSKSVQCPGNTDTSASIDLNIDYNLFAMRVELKNESVGDKWSAYANKDTVIGTVTETVADSTDIKMDSKSIAVIKPGFYLSFDGGITNYMAVATDTDTVTIESKVSVTAGDVVTMTYYVTYKKDIIVAGISTVGESILGSSFLSKDLNMGIIYHNVSNSVKTIEITAEMTF